MTNSQNNLIRRRDEIRDVTATLFTVAAPESHVPPRASPDEFFALHPHSGEVERLLAIIDDALRQFANQQQQLATLRPEPVVLDFSLGTLIRPHGEPVPLPHCLATQMLDQLGRTQMSVARFLLLRRSKQLPVRSSYRQTLSAFRHELTAVRRMVAQFDLPIEIERAGPWIRARFDWKRIRTNVMNGRLLAKDAKARLAMYDFSAAIDYAGQALREDFDCSEAATIVVRVLRIKDDQLNEEVVARAQVCLARAIVRCTAAMRRLDERSSNPDIARARKIARRLEMQLERQWHALLSWPFDDPSRNRLKPDRQTSVRDFIEIWVKVFRGDPLAYGAFVNSLVIDGVVSHLLKTHGHISGSQRAQDMTENLRHEIFERLAVSAWLPEPVTSQRQLQDQLLEFLARRIDWETLSSRTGTRTAEFRDDLYDQGDDDDDAE